MYTVILLLVFVYPIVTIGLVAVFAIILVEKNNKNIAKVLRNFFFYEIYYFHYVDDFIW